MKPKNTKFLGLILVLVFADTLRIEKPGSTFPVCPYQKEHPQSARRRQNSSLQILEGDRKGKTLFKPYFWCKFEKKNSHFRKVYTGHIFIFDLFQCKNEVYVIRYVQHQSNTVTSSYPTIDSR